MNGTLLIHRIKKKSPHDKIGQTNLRKSFSPFLRKRKTFEAEEDAEEQRDWLEVAFQMAFRVCEYEGEFYCILTESLPWHIRKDESS